MLAAARHRGPKISPSKRGMFVRMRQAGLTFTAISENVACSADAAWKLWNRYLERGTVYLAAQPGKPKVLSERDSRHLKRYVTHDRETRRESLTAILENLNLNAHPDTIATELKSFGLRHRIACKRPYLSKKQKEARLAFAKKYIYWMAEEWRCVIFTDEMGMQTGSNGGRV